MVSPNWQALVWGDYESVLPLPIIQKGGVNQIIQPIFTRELVVLGKPQSTESILNFLKKNYKNVDVRFADLVESLSSESRSHQIIDLKPDFQSHYSTNAKRLIKKASNYYEYREVEVLDQFIALIRETLVPKIEEFTVENVEKLKLLMETASAKHRGVCYAIFNKADAFVGAGFFFKHQQSLTYLKGAATDHAKKQGAMFGLINYAIEQNESTYQILDFGGSDIKNVADFYRKFGASDRNYYHYQLNRLPVWYKLAKKMSFKK